MWDLLGDVGGFNDGLLLLCSIFMSSYSAFSFTLDVLNQFPIDLSRSSMDSKGARFTDSVLYLRTVSKLRTPVSLSDQQQSSYKVDADMIKVLKWALDRAKRIR